MVKLSIVKFCQSFLMNQIMKMRKAKGFTLVELLIVIIIIIKTLIIIVVFIQ